LQAFFNHSDKTNFEKTRAAYGVILSTQAAFDNEADA
jgi:hypothetical protein